MLFNSIEFAIFLSIVFILYWFAFQKNVRLQNIFLIIVSYFFYSWWDWRFLSLLFIITLVNYFVGLILARQETETKRKALILVSILINIGILGFFKYFNFFLDSLNIAYTFLGSEISFKSLDIVLPLGISFYIFKILGYSIDIYLRKIEPEKDFIAFAAFVSFFPQLLAGPIDRAANLLPQFHKRRIFDYDKAKDGLRQILWGLFKKIVIADNAAIQVNYIFNNYESLNASTLLLGVFYFAFQIYGDFSGYSDIAIGTGRLIGFNQMKNFAFPYFSKNIKEFWQSWHISLSTWFRDYIFPPLAYSLTRRFRRKQYFGLRSDKIVYAIGTIITFLLCGLWHGANWTFVIWGLLHGIYLVFGFITKNFRKRIRKTFSLERIPFLSEILTFILSAFAWIFFRADNVEQAFIYIRQIFSMSLLSLPERWGTIPMLLIFIAIEWMQRNKVHGLQLEDVIYTSLRWAIYSVIILILFNFYGLEQRFIYFQF